MTGQVYISSSPQPSDKFIYLFEQDSLVAKLPLRYFTDKSADESLLKMRLKRKGKWRDTSWGREATIYFHLDKTA